MTDTDPDDVLMMDVRCTECDRDEVRSLTGPEPPDPDRHGTMRAAFKCPGCAERGALVFPAPGTHGPTWIDGPDRFELPESRR